MFRHGLCRLGVQRGRGLVAQQHIGVVGQCSGNGDALLLPAGELTGVGICFIRNAHKLQQTCYLVCRFFLAQSAATQRIGHISGNRTGRHQIKMLKDHSNLLPCLPEFVRGQCRDLFSTHRDRARGGPLQKIDTPDKCGFSGSGKSDDPENLTLIDRQGNIAHGMDLLLSLPEILGNVCQFDQADSSFKTKSGELKSSPLQMRKSLCILSTQTHSTPDVPERQQMSTQNRGHRHSHVHTHAGHHSRTLMKHSRCSFPLTYYFCWLYNTADSPRCQSESFHSIKFGTFSKV